VGVLAIFLLTFLAFLPSIITEYVHLYRILDRSFVLLLLIPLLLVAALFFPVIVTLLMTYAIHALLPMLIIFLTSALPILSLPVWVFYLVSAVSFFVISYGGFLCVERIIRYFVNDFFNDGKHDFDINSRERYGLFKNYVFFKEEDYPSPAIKWFIGNLKKMSTEGDPMPLIELLLYSLHGNLNKLSGVYKDIDSKLLLVKLIAEASSKYDGFYDQVKKTFFYYVHQYIFLDYSDFYDGHFLGKKTLSKASVEMVTEIVKNNLGEAFISSVKRGLPDVVSGGEIIVERVDSDLLKVIQSMLDRPSVKLLLTSPTPNMPSAIADLTLSYLSPLMDSNSTPEAQTPASPPST
jgi:hypothetical protein